MQHQPNLIKLSVEAAGGRRVVAERFSVSKWTVTSWITKRSVPVQHIAPLCDLGGVIEPGQLLKYIAAQASEKVAA